MDDKQAGESEPLVPVLDYAEPIARDTLFGDAESFGHEMVLPKHSMLLFFLSVPALGIGGVTVIFPLAGFAAGLVAVVKHWQNTRARVALLLNTLILVLWVSALAGVRF